MLSQGKDKATIAEQLGVARTVYRLRSNKKTILSLLSDKDAQITNLIEINRLKFSSDRDVVAVFNFYNTID